MSTFNDIEELDDFLDDMEGTPWIAVQDARDDLYLVFPSEDDGTAYQGIPFELERDEDGETKHMLAVDTNSGLFSETQAGPVFPLTRLERASAGDGS